MGTTPVQVRLQQRTIDSLNDLRDLTGKNRTQVIISAIALMTKVVKAQREGGATHIETADGQLTRIEFIDLVTEDE